MVKRMLRRLRAAQGFTLVELLMALTLLNVGILAILGAFTSGAVAIKRASRVSTASALADAQMELYRGVPYSSIALGANSILGAPGAQPGDYKCDSALGTGCPNSTTNEVTGPDCGANYCKASRSASGADGGTYIVDTYILQADLGPRARKVTVVVRDSLKKTRVYVRQTSTFDQATG